MLIEIPDGESIALVTAAGAETSYHALGAEVSAAAGRLRAAGAGPGRAVAVGLSDARQFIAATLAVWECGAVLVPLDVRAGLTLVQPLIARARPALLWTDQGMNAQPNPRAIDSRAALLLFTSGSSGPPKGVLLSRDGLRANSSAILEYLPMRAHPRTALVLPLTYSYALVGQALTTLQAGGTLLLLGGLKYPEEQLSAMVELRASGLSSVPTSLRLLARAVAEGATAPALGYLASAGAPLDERTASALRLAFPNAQLWNQYGLTEASPRVAAIASSDPAFARGAVGRPLRGIELWATDGARRLPAGESGEIALRGPSVMLGYLDDPDATARAIDERGALRTGDLGFIDESGCLFITGRGDGVVKCAGERVGLEEVAAALCDCKGVADACVVALTDEALGARLVGFIEADAAAIGAVQRELRALLPPAKRPTRLIAVESLPRLPSGKIDRKALEQRAKELA